MRSSPKLAATAILAVYNAEATLEACLQTLTAQSAKLEIIIVDDGSTDATSVVISQFTQASKSGHIRAFSQNHAGPAAARNLGARHARTDILLFVDADMTFDRSYVQLLIAPIRKGLAIGTYTVEERVANWDNVWARCWNWQEGWEAGKRFPADPPKYGTDYRAILKSEFDHVGGFDSIGYTDTWTLFRKLGVRPLGAKAVCYHQNPSSLAHVFNQAKWSSKRPYKFGSVGTLYALVRTSLPVSVVAGIWTALRTLTWQFLPFKLVYDLGRFLGIIQMVLGGRISK